MAQAKANAEQAKLSYSGTVYHPDQPYWREALRLGEEALRQAPDDLNSLHFLAISYGYVRWYVRAWEHWQRYLQYSSLEQAQMLDVQSKQLFAQAGTELGYARYLDNDLQGALPYYETVLSHLPENEETLTWLGRIYLELAQPEQALPYWDKLSELKPADDSIRYYRNLANEQISVGREASSAFQQGISAYDVGDKVQALEHFLAAVAVNERFVNAYVWAARSSLELGRPEASAKYWQKVLELNPNDERASYFLELAQAQSRWGIEAANAFYEGQTLHFQGDIENAARSFEAAFILNPAYKEAAVWAARSFQEINKPDRAIPYWDKVIELDPSDKRAIDFLRLAVQQNSHGLEAGRAYIDGIAAFEQANFSEAERLFKTAINEDERFADAWAWLGRLYFTLGHYAAAATSYQKATELEPSNEGYHYFAKEAALLAADSD